MFAACPLLQVDALRSVVGQLEVSAAAAEAEYNRQLARNKDELAGLRQSRGQELTGMLVGGGCIRNIKRQKRRLQHCAALNADGLCLRVATATDPRCPSVFAVRVQLNVVLLLHAAGCAGDAGAET